MNLELELDWERSEVKGRSEVFLKPYFYRSDSLQLDAKDFVINKISAKYNEESVLRSFKYDGNKILIYLSKELNSDDSLRLNIQYTARPDSLNDHASGKAIASEKGLFFINPKGLKTSKPRQVWTQGETEFNSRWFPCIDKPNERITHQISIKVDKGMKSLSNGELMFSSINKDGSHMDVWEMNKPHAPYLVMIAVGDFDMVKDTSTSLDVNYWVEHDFRHEAKAIFGRTPEMIELFSKLTGVDYPWNKFDQIVVRDYISGAMENTTAVIHGEFLYHRERELIDADEEDIIAHELFHQWFGDLVTCESWSNLTLNEGFASYGEYLWREHSKGKDWAQYVLMEFKQNYMEEARFVQKPLIRYNYRSEDELFDRHSYDKGALALHMLRSYLGDDAFFAGINRYLRNKAFQSAEVADLRLAMEDVTGLDLKWFFDQWFLRKGHPDLEIAYAVKEEFAEVLVIQKHDIEDFGVFQFPIQIKVELKDTTIYHDFFVRNEVSILSIPIDSTLQYISFDPTESLLAEKHETKSLKWLQNELRSSGNIEKIWRIWIHLLDRSLEEDVELSEAYEFIRSHPSQHLRKLCIEWLDRDIIGKYKLVDQIRKSALEDSSSVVRNEALNQLLNLAYPEKKLDFITLCNDSSILVSSTAVSGLALFSIKDALFCANSIKDSPYDDHLLALAAVYSNDASPEHVYFFNEAYERMNAFKSPELISTLSDYLQRTPSVDSKVEGLTLIQDYMLNQTVWWQKIVGVDALNALKLQHESIIRKSSKKAADPNLNDEEKAKLIASIMGADRVIETISSVREAVLATEMNARIKELMR